MTESITGARISGVRGDRLQFGTNFVLRTFLKKL